jgi:hypothetical protein
MHAKRNVETKEVVTYQFGKSFEKFCLRMLENCPEILEVCGAIRLTEVYLDFTFYLFIFSLLSAMISSSSCAFPFSPHFLPSVFSFLWCREPVRTMAEKLHVQASGCSDLYPL